MQKKISAIERENNNLNIYKLNHPASISDFIRSMFKGKEKGYQQFNICWKGEESAIYPNACLPIAAIIEFYREQGNEFVFEIFTSEYLNNCYFANPLKLDVEGIRSLYNPFDKIIKYDNSAQVAEFTQKCVDNISCQMVCEEGIFESLIWCINEVMDNVLVHSKNNTGYVMAQFHAASKHIAICVADTGIGIFNSLKNSTHHPRKAIDAISLAIQEGVGDGQGQGNGLFGLYQIIQANGGRLTITSGSASLMLAEEKPLQKFDRLPYINKTNQATIVDFQLDLNKNVNIKEAFRSIGGFDGFDIRLDNMIQDNDSLLYDVFNNCEGTATREAGKMLRNDVLNTIKRTKSLICLDFSKVLTVSSSFIDEFVAKMVIELGFINFNKIISLTGMNDTIKFLCERSLYMRIFEEWNIKESSKSNLH